MWAVRGQRSGRLSDKSIDSEKSSDGWDGSPQRHVEESAESDQGKEGVAEQMLDVGLL